MYDFTLSDPVSNSCVKKLMWNLFCYSPSSNTAVQMCVHECSAQPPHYLVYSDNNDNKLT